LERKRYKTYLSLKRRKKMKFDTAEINRLMRTRRSVFPKDYSGEKVNDLVINQMLENASLAPNHKLTEPWRFVVFTGDGMKRLAELQAKCYKEVTSLNGSFREERYQSLLTKPMQSSHIIALGMKRDERKGLPEIEEAGAVFCAIENMYLTAAAYGVGCYLSTGGITYFEEAKVLFGLGPDDKLLGFMHVGMPKAWPPEVKRRSIQEKATWITVY
jgi:nitroreductase